MQPWLDRLLGVVQMLAIIAAIAIGLWWLTHWAEAHHRAVVEQIDRVEASVNEIEASVNEVRDFTRTIRPAIEANARRIERVEAESKGQPDPDPDPDPEANVNPDPPPQ